MDYLWIVVPLLAIALFVLYAPQIGKKKKQSAPKPVEEELPMTAKEFCKIFLGINDISGYNLKAGRYKKNLKGIEFGVRLVDGEDPLGDMSAERFLKDFFDVILFDVNKADKHPSAQIVGIIVSGEKYANVGISGDYGTIIEGEYSKNIAFLGKFVY